MVSKATGVRVESDDGPAGVPTVDGDRVLAALGDGDCRTILAAVTEVARCVEEISSVCGLPLSTTYRKIRRLESAGLIAERTRVDGENNHPSEYTAVVEELGLRLDDSRVQVTLDFRDDRSSVTGVITD